MENVSRRILEYLQSERKYVLCARGMFSWCQVIFNSPDCFFFNPSNLNEILKKPQNPLDYIICKVFFSNSVY